MRWYKIIIYKAHMGAGKNFRATAYIYGKNIVSVFDVYKKIPGVKKNLRGGNKFPDIFQLTLEDSRKLEEKIISEGRISLNAAKRKCYYSELAEVE